MGRKTIPVLSIVLYVLAALLLGYTVWAVTNAVTYISTMIDQGQLIVSGNEFDIANFVMSNALQYLVYAVTLFALGWIAQRVWAAPALTAEYLLANDIYDVADSEDDWDVDEDEDEVEGWDGSDDDEVVS